MVVKGGTVSGALIRGISPVPESTVSTVTQSMVSGEIDSLTSRSWNIVIGANLASKLGGAVGDKVTLVAPKGQLTPAGLLPRLKRFRVSGVFELGMYEYDSVLTLIHIDDLSLIHI